MSAARLRRVFFQIHMWMGVLSGLYIFVVCLSGAALVFRIDIQRAVHPQLFTASADGPLIDAATMLERVREAYPQGRVSGVEAPTTSRPTYLAYVVDGPHFSTILIDPVTARILGELPEQSFVRTLQDLHYDLLAGRTGRMVNGLGAICILVMCLTGAVIWWPGVKNWRRGLVVNRTRTWKRLIWELHGAIGIWTLILIAMWAVTGLYFAFPSAFRAAINRVSPLTVTRSMTSAPPTAGDVTPPSWRRLIEIAQEHALGQHVARVVVPANERGAFLVMFSTSQPTPSRSGILSSVYLDQFTGAVLREPPRAARSAGDLVIAWVAPLHVGSFGGRAIKVVWLFFGLAPPLLFATGFAMWWTRVVRRANVRSALGAR